MPDRRVAADISVVIPTVGRDLLRGCLDSIASGTTLPAEVIVVNQGDPTTVAPWIGDVTDRGLSVRHVASDRTGIAAATNDGLARVATPFVATTHDDCRVAADWLERLRATLGTTSAAVVTGRVDAVGSGLVLTVTADLEPVVYARPLRDRDVLFPANMGFALDVLERVGWFDEHPSLRVAGEDNDWAYRALRAHVSIVYAPDVRVQHVAWRSPTDRLSLYRTYARGQGAFYGKHLRRGDAFIAGRAARSLARAPWLVVRGAVSRNADLLAMGMGELIGLPAGLVAGLRNTRARERRARHEDGPEDGPAGGRS